MTVQLCGCVPCTEQVLVQTSELWAGLAGEQGKWSEEQQLMGTANLMCQQLGQAVVLGQLLGWEAKASCWKHPHWVFVCVYSTSWLQLDHLEGIHWAGSALQFIISASSGCLCEQPCELMCVYPPVGYLCSVQLLDEPGAHPAAASHPSGH